MATSILQENIFTYKVFITGKELYSYLMQQALYRPMTVSGTMEESLINNTYAISH